MGIYRSYYAGLAWLFASGLSTHSFAATGQLFGSDVAEEARVLSPQQLRSQQALPELSGRVSTSRYSPPPGALDMNAAVQRSVQWYPDISAEISKLFTQTSKVEIERAKYYPQISGGINNGIANTYVDHGYSPSLVLSISQMLYDFGKVDSSVRAANAAVAAQQANVLLTIDKIAHDTAAALVEVHGYQELVKIAQEQLIALNNISRLARDRSDEGASSQSDVVQTDARIEGARNTLTQYQASLERWRATLSTYLGWEQTNAVSGEFPRVLNGACHTGDIDDQMVPSVLVAHAQLNQAAAQLAGANAQLLPTVSLEPQITHYLNDRYANSEQLDKTQYTAWLRVQMPLYQGGALTAGKEAAQYSLDAATASVRSAQLQVRQQLNEASNQAASLEQALLIQARQQQLSERTRELYQQQYLQLGTRPLLDVLNVEQEVFQSRFAEQQTRSQLRSLQLDCLYSTGHIRKAFTLDGQTIQGVEIQP